MQQWYGDASFSGFSFDYGGMVWCILISLLLLTPLLWQICNMLKKLKTKMTTMTEASRRPPQHFLVLNGKGGVKY
jgi:hypothetical protein